MSDTYYSTIIPYCKTFTIKELKSDEYKGVLVDLGEDKNTYYLESFEIKISVPVYALTKSGSQYNSVRTQLDKENITSRQGIAIQRRPKTTANEDIDENEQICLFELEQAYSDTSLYFTTNLNGQRLWESTNEFGTLHISKVSIKKLALPNGVTTTFVANNTDTSSTDSTKWQDDILIDIIYKIAEYTSDEQDYNNQQSSSSTTEDTTTTLNGVTYSNYTGTYYQMNEDGSYPSDYVATEDTSVDNYDENILYDGTYDESK